MANHKKNPKVSSNNYTQRSHAQQHYYSNSSEALDYKIYSDHKYKKSRKRKVLRRIKKGTVIRRVKNDSSQISKYLVITIAIVFSGVMSIALNYSRIANDRAEIRVLSNDLQKLKEENSALEFQISESYDLAEISRLAMSRLGMHKPRPYQIVYISVPAETSVVRNATNPSERRDEGSAFLEKILQFFYRQQR